MVSKHCHVLNTDCTAQIDTDSRRWCTGLSEYIIIKVIQGVPRNFGTSNFGIFPSSVIFDS